MSAAAASRSTSSEARPRGTTEGANAPFFLSRTRMNLNQNHFELFDLPSRFVVDVAALEARYHERLREVHPDRFAAAPELERRASMQLATRVNEAYQTLKSPLKRAVYILRLRGVDPVRNGIAVVLNDHEGRALLPSIVRYLGDGRVAVGVEAEAALARDPRNTVVSVKRFMGRGLKDVTHVENSPYDFLDSPGMVRIRTAAGVKSPVEVSADILKVLRARAEESLGGELTGAIITVPAYFDDAQRQATKDAGKLAGLNVLRLLNEPTAAAIAYGLENAAEGIYAVDDLGGGPVDRSILKLSKGVFEVMATNGDAALGGDDFDQRLFCWILERAKLAPLSAEDTRVLLTKARAAKELLTAHSEARISARLAGGETVDVTVTQKEFQEMTRPLVAKPP